MITADKSGVSCDFCHRLVKNKLAVSGLVVVVLLFVVAMLANTAFFLWLVNFETLPFERVAEALSEGLARTLNLSLLPGALTAAERARAEDLRRERYVAAEWTART